MAFDRCMKFTYYSCNSFVIALLLLSVTVKGQQSTDKSLKLRNLFEKALVNSSESLYHLQQIYFNPTSIRSPSPFCLNVNVTVDNIRNLDSSYCDSNYNDSAFFCCNCHPNCSELTPNCSKWSFTQSYELKLAEFESDSSELNDLLTSSGITSAFYAFDPSFYTTIRALSYSIGDVELSFPDHDYQSSTGNLVRNISFHVSEDFDEMPCWRDADYALSMVLVWVSMHA